MNYDIIIIGGGVAGLSAAIYARRANKSVLVLESTAVGGQVLQIAKIANYPGTPDISGKDLAKNMHTQAKNLGANFKTEKVVCIKREASYAISKNNPDDHTSKHVEAPHFEIRTDAFSGSADADANSDQNFSGLYHAKAVIIATGTDYRRIGLPHETELTGHGVSYCATCDGALYKGKTVAVYGGGNSAFYSALYLSRIAKKVHLIHHSDSFRADAALVEQAKIAKNIDFVLGYDINELKGTDSLTGVRLKNGSEIKLSALFVTIGREPRLDFLNDDSISVKLDQSGAIKTNEKLETSEPGLFAAGDCVSKEIRQIVTATSDGAIAASNAVKFLS